jgi:hypothetical protein
VSPRRVARHFTEDLFRVYGFSFRFRTNRVAAQRCILRLYQRVRSENGAETTVDAVLEGDGIGGFRWQLGETAGTNSDLRGALWNLEAALCQAIIRSQPRRMAVHGSAIYAGDSAMLLVGRSGAGKTTLTLALARRGLAVATDDVALVDPETLDVHPIPRCFHLDGQSVALLEADGFRFPPSWERLSFMVPSDLGVQAERPGRARLLVFISGPRAEQPLLTPISQAEMVARLLSETGQGPIEDPEIVRGLCGLASRASCYSLIPGPLALTADALTQLIGGSPGDRASRIVAL